MGKEKIITVWTNKGGNAKSSISLAFSLEFGFPIVTNDTASPIGEILGEGWAIVLDLDEDIPEDILTSGDKVLFDLGGKAEDRVVIAAQHSDVIIMPIIHRSRWEMDVFKLSVDAMLDINPNIVLVAAGTKPAQLKKTMQELSHCYPNLPLLEISESTAFTRMAEEGKSIKDICSDEPFLAHHYAKITKQLHKLMQVAFEVSENAKAA